MHRRGLGNGVSCRRGGGTPSCRDSRAPAAGPACWTRHARGGLRGVTLYAAERVRRAEGETTAGVNRTRTAGLKIRTTQIKEAYAGRTWAASFLPQTVTAAAAQRTTKRVAITAAAPWYSLHGTGGSSLFGSVGNMLQEEQQQQQQQQQQKRRRRRRRGRRRRRRRRRRLLLLLLLLLLLF
eukprot:gene18309-biopygen12953